jgi:hypothetical protein
VAGLETDETGCGWANLDLSLSVDGKAVTDCTARVALPVTDDDNPWKRDGNEWKP